MPGKDTVLVRIVLRSVSPVLKWLVFFRHGELVTASAAAVVSLLEEAVRTAGYSGQLEQMILSVQACWPCCTFLAELLRQREFRIFRALRDE